MGTGSLSAQSRRPVNASAAFQGRMVTPTVNVRLRERADVRALESRLDARRRRRCAAAQPVTLTLVTAPLEPNVTCARDTSSAPATQALAPPITEPTAAAPSPATAARGCSGSSACRRPAPALRLPAGLPPLSSPTALLPSPSADRPACPWRGGLPVARRAGVAAGVGRATARRRERPPPAARALGQPSRCSRRPRRIGRAPAGAALRLGSGRRRRGGRPGGARRWRRLRRRLRPPRGGRRRGGGGVRVLTTAKAAAHAEHRDRDAGDRAARCSSSRERRGVGRLHGRGSPRAAAVLLVVLEQARARPASPSRPRGVLLRGRRRADRVAGRRRPSRPCPPPPPGAAAQRRGARVRARRGDGVAVADARTDGTGVEIAGRSRRDGVDVGARRRPRLAGPLGHLLQRLALLRGAWTACAAARLGPRLATALVVRHLLLSCCDRPKLSRFGRARRAPRTAAPSAPGRRLAAARGRIALRDDGVRALVPRGARRRTASDRDLRRDRALARPPTRSTRSGAGHSFSRAQASMSALPRRLHASPSEPTRRQVLPQLAPRLVHAPGDRPLRATEDLRCIVVRHAVDAHEDQRRAQRVARACRCPSHSARGELPLLRRRRRVAALARARLGEQRLDPRVVRGRRVAASILRARMRVEREVHRDAVEPRERLAPAVEPVERLVGADERLLRHVLGLRARANEVEREPEDPPLVPAHERAERLRVARLGLVDELTIGGLGHPSAARRSPRGLSRAQTGGAGGHSGTGGRPPNGARCRSRTIQAREHSPRTSIASSGLGQATSAGGPRVERALPRLPQAASRGRRLLCVAAMGTQAAVMDASRSGSSLGARFAGGAVTSHLAHATTAGGEPLRAVRSARARARARREPVRRAGAAHQGRRGRDQGHGRRARSALGLHDARRSSRCSRARPRASSAASASRSTSATTSSRSSRPSRARPRRAPASARAIRSSRSTASPMRGERIDKLVTLMRGPAGTKVRVTVRRAGVAEPLTFDLVREEIHVHERRRASASTATSATCASSSSRRGRTTSCSRAAAQAPRRVEGAARAA